MRNRIPDFFIVGAPKCGTTSLYEWLSTHPEICAPHKETCFFSQDIYSTHDMPTNIPSLEDYCNIFRLEPGQKVSGEATPKYLYSDQALSEIALLNPEAKIIVCLRDPVDLVISLHNQKLKEGVEYEPDFSKAWARSVSAVKNPDSILEHELNYYLWGCIGDRLEVLHKIFPSSNILIFTLHDLKANPRESYLELLMHLGLKDDGRNNFSVSNERLAISNLILHRALIKVRKRLSWFLKYLWAVRGGRGLGVISFFSKFYAKEGEYTSSVSDFLRCEVYTILKPQFQLSEKYLADRCLSKQVR
jgi:hypothetical protein